MPDRLYFTDSDEANALIASDPMALLVGFALDQQVSVQKAFSGPLAMRERLGARELGELLAAQRLTGMLEEHAEELPFRRRHLDRQRLPIARASCGLS